MATKHPKVETFATLSAKVAEYERVFPMLQAQAEQAMMMAAAEKGKYLHVLKLFAAVVAQNMQAKLPTIVLHKSIVDQPDTINISREPYPADAAEDAQVGYSYRIVSAEELEALNVGAASDDRVLPEQPAPVLLDAGGNPVSTGEADDSGQREGNSDGTVEAPEAASGNVRKVLRKKR